MIEEDVHSRAANIIQDLGSNNDININEDKITQKSQDFTSTTTNSQLTTTQQQFVVVEVIPIHGMTCQSCVKSITNAVSLLFGIANIRVSLENNEAIVSFDTSKITKSTIIETIENCGFVVPRSTSTSQKTI